MRHGNAIVLLFLACLVHVGQAQLRRTANDEFVSNGDYGARVDDCLDTLVTVSLTFDTFPEETSWVLSDSSGGIISSGENYPKEFSGSTLSAGFCLADDCYSFTISDARGDGICCGRGNGAYSVSSSETVFASGGSFALSESNAFCIGDGETTTVSADQATTTASPSTILTAVTIIGAGAAGLAASYTLKHHNVTDFVIVEASNMLGGRAQKDTSFTNGAYPLDLGPSFIKYPDAIRRIIGRDDVMEEPPGTGLPNFVNYSYHDFLNDYIAPSDATIHYGCRVTSVEYTTNEVVTVCQDGNVFQSQFVILTVPLPILKEGDIAFNPPLPTSMTVNHPGWMWGGFKIIFEFQSDFVGSFCFPDIPGAQGECLNLDGESLFWDASAINQRLDNGNTIVAGYILGKPSDPFVTLSDDNLAERVLALMDEIYNGQASENLVGYLVINWSKNPNIRGTLSSWGYDKPGTGNPSGAQNIQDKVWVAGEAFPVDGSNGWVDSGIFSGDDAAKQILSRHYGIDDDTWFWRKVWQDLGRD